MEATIQTPLLDVLDKPQALAEALMRMSGRYVEFRYVPQLPPPKLTPSVIEKKRDEKHVGEPDVVKGFLDPELTIIRQTKDGNWTITLHTMNRRKFLGSPEGVYAKYGYEKGEYLPRCYRMEGIRLDTFFVSDGSKGKVRGFPEFNEEEF